MTEDWADPDGSPGIEQFSALFEKSPDGLMVVDANSGLILLANKIARRMFGFQGESGPFGNVTTIFPSEVNESVQEALDKVKVYGGAFVQQFQGNWGDQMMDLTATLLPWIGERKVILASFRDASEREALMAEKEELIGELKQAVARVKRLSGLLPICSSCKKVRDDSGYWHRVEIYLQDHADARLTHGICPECMAIHYPDLEITNCDEEQET